MVPGLDPRQARRILTHAVELDRKAREMATTTAVLARSTDKHVQAMRHSQAFAEKVMTWVVDKMHGQAPQCFIREVRWFYF